jgi:hypothetical protein
MSNAAHKDAPAYHSAAYQAAREKRAGAAEFKMLLPKGAQ